LGTYHQAKRRKVKIRRYTPEDRDQLASLWRRTFPEDPPHNEPSQVIDAKLKMDSLIFIAEDGGAIVGAVMAGYDGHRGWLYAVAVDASARRNGIGSALVKEAIAALEQLGCIKVNLQVRSSNSSVVSFYESLGFKVEERISMGMLLKPGTQQSVGGDDDD
jgi:ribosomal protein S18 acetylase RimI-like enzyme